MTECRNNALETLDSDKHYAERKQSQADIRAKLAALSPSAEAAGAVQSMEYSAILLCGLTVQSDIGRRFDAATPEYKAFAENYV